ncbi:MAG: hypothetical protein ACUVXA_06340 [Candidatus Jordarchaeum sp.]|uniref:hypothetical protein n=1 Tax=Candidatus Jordarchaeum sp. TaxID=2823881 RepID=UPI004049EA98
MAFWIFFFSLWFGSPLVDAFASYMMDRIVTKDAKIFKNIKFKISRNLGEKRIDLILVDYSEKKTWLIEVKHQFSTKTVEEALGSLLLAHEILTKEHPPKITTKRYWFFKGPEIDTEGIKDFEEEKIAVFWQEPGEKSLEDSEREEELLIEILRKYEIRTFFKKEVDFIEV